MNKASKKYGIMWKDITYTWSVYLNIMGRINLSWKTHSRIFPGELPQTSKAVQFKFKKYTELHKDIPQEEQPQGT